MNSPLRCEYCGSYHPYGVYRCQGCGAPVDGAATGINWDAVDAAAIPHSELHRYISGEAYLDVPEEPPVPEPVYLPPPPAPVYEEPSKWQDFWNALQVIIGIAFVIGFVYVLINDHRYLWPFLNWLFK